MPKPPAPAPAAAEPLAAFDRRLDPSAQAPLAVGFSGGGDSLALLLIAQTWAAAHGRRLIALTVDHGLHADSRSWTEAAGEAARRAGVAWRPLAWSAEKPHTGLQAAARAARHRLLAEAARVAGARVILLGHTLDDVEEGERMRDTDAPTLGRLRTWAPSPVWPEGRGLFLLRPLLGMRRAALRERLKAQGWEWRDDPANEDLRFARTRARAYLATRRGELRPDVLTAAEPGSRSFPTYTVTLDGRVLVARTGMTRAFLSAALLCAGGGEGPPRGERLSRLMERMEAGGPVSATLAGARVEMDGEQVSIGREAGERLRGGLAPLALVAGRPGVWDGRFLVSSEVDGLCAAPLAGRIGDLTRNDRLRLKAYPVAARSALPVLVGALGAALPRPFGEGPGRADCLVGERLAAACGQVESEAQLLR